jgi:hypothetical protein
MGTLWSFVVDLRWAIAVLAIVLIASSCTETVDAGTEIVSENQSAQWTKISEIVTGSGLFRYVDLDADVVCWVSKTYDGARGTGISCLPIEDTTLGKGVGQ